MSPLRINKLKNIFIKFERVNDLLIKKNMFLINIGAKSKIYEVSTYENLKSIFTISNLKFGPLLPKIKYVFNERELRIKRQYYQNNLIKIIFLNCFINIYPKKFFHLRNLITKYIFLFKATFCFTNYSDIISAISLFYF